MATPSSAFTLLWKIVEVVERACPSEPLFEDSVLTNIETILKNEIPQVSLDRVVGSLKSMQAASQPARFVKGASHLFPGWEFDEKEVLKVIRESRSARGKHFHPVDDVDPYDGKLIAAFLKLRGVIKEMIRSPYKKSDQASAGST
jgi:hypothetical protein